MASARGRAPVTAALGEQLGPHPGTFYSRVLPIKESVMYTVNLQTGQEWEEEWELSEHLQGGLAWGTRYLSVRE